MKKLLLTVSCLMMATTAMFAQKYMTRTGRISFNATAAKSPEKIEAINNEVANIVDAKTGDIVFQVLIKSFKFERELMQEHFNENYMQSDKFPKSEFKGKIDNLSDVNFTKDGTYNAKVSGKLTIHGVTKDVNVPGTIAVKGNTVAVKAKFSVKLNDYNIDIPAMVADKVGKDATITLEGNLTQK
ncbi:MAG: polyisoprenoid-binding protein [Flavipsychrobacter sp.]|nr:polyisoprenoid-binding protein [Flavipsychrobacter sp.]